MQLAGNDVLQGAGRVANLEGARLQPPIGIHSQVHGLLTVLRVQPASSLIAAGGTCTS